jgi:hypothetical protein
MRSFVALESAGSQSATLFALVPITLSEAGITQ